MKKTTLSKLLAMMLATAMLMSAAPMTTLAAVGDVTPVTINAVGSKGQANVIGNQDTSVSLKIPSVWPTGYSVSSVGLVPVSALSNPPASSELDGAAIVGFTDARYDTGGGPGSYMVTGIDLSQVIDWQTGNNLAPGLYRAVVWAGPAGGGEETLYSSNTITLVEGTGCPFNLSSSQMRVTPPNGNVGTPVQLTLMLNAGQLFSIGGGGALDISVENLDFTNATLLSPGGGTLSDKNMGSVRVSMPGLTIGPTGSSVVLGNVVPIAATAEGQPYISLSDTTGMLGAAYLAPLTFNTVGISTLAPSTLTATQSYLGAAADLTLTLASNGSISAAAGSTVTLDAAGLDFTNALLPAGYTATSKTNGQLVFTIDAATNITAAGTVIAVTGAVSKQTTVNAKVTLNNGTPIVTSFPALTFPARKPVLTMDVSASAWVVNTDGSMSNPVTVTVKTVYEDDPNTVDTDINGTVRLGLSGTPYVAINGNGTLSIQLVNGVGTLDVTSILYYSPADYAATVNYTLTASTNAYNGGYLTASAPVSTSIAARKLSGHVTLATGEPYSGALVTVFQQAIGWGTGGYPQMSITIKADDNGYYELSLPAPRVNGGFTPFIISAGMDTERQIYAATSPTQVVDGAGNISPVADIVCDNYVTVTANVYEHPAVPDGSQPADYAAARDPSMLQDARTFKFDAPNKLTDFNAYYYSDIITATAYLGDNTWAVPCKTIRNLTNNGATPLQFRARTHPQQAGNTIAYQENFDTLNYDPAVNRYTLNFDSKPNGYVELYNPDVANDGGAGNSEIAVVFVKNQNYVPGSSDYWKMSPYQSASGLLRMRPGQRVTSGNYATAQDVIVVVADDKYSPLFSGVVNYINANWVAADGTVNIPGLDPAAYKVYTGKVGLGVKYKIADGALPYNSALTPNLPDNPSARVLGINGNEVSIAFSISAVNSDKQLLDLQMVLSNGLAVNEHRAGGWMYVVYPDGTRQSWQTIENTPPYHGTIALTNADWTHRIKSNTLFKGDTLLIVVLAQIEDMSKTDLAVDLQIGGGYGSPLTYTIASVNFSAQNNLTMNVDTYTDKYYVNVTGGANPGADVNIYVNDVLNQTVKASKAGSYFAMVELFSIANTDKRPADGTRFTVSAESDNRITLPRDVMYMNYLPKIVALADMNNKTMIHSLRRGMLPIDTIGGGGPIITRWDNMTAWPVDMFNPGIQGPEQFTPTGADAWIKITENPDFFQNFSGVWDGLMMTQNGFKRATGWQWSELGPCMLRYTPGGEMEFRVMTDGDDAISKMWVNVYNGMGGSDLIIPAVYDAAKGYWVAKDVMPTTDFAVLNYGVEYTLKLDAGFAPALDGNTDSPLYNINIDIPARLAAAQDALNSYAMPAAADDPNAASNLWNTIVQANPDMASMTVTDPAANGSQTVSYYDSAAGKQVNITGHMEFSDMSDPANVTAANALLSSPDAISFGQGGKYIQTAVAHYTQNGAQKQMDLDALLLILSAYDSLPAGAAALGIDNNFTIEFRDVMKLPSSGGVTPVAMQAMPATAKVMLLSAAGDPEYDNSNLVDGKTLVNTTFDLQKEVYSDDLEKMGVNPVLDAIATGQSLQDIWDAVTQNCDIKDTWRQYKELLTRLQSLTNTECFNMMDGYDRVDMLNAILKANENYAEYSKWQRHTRAYNNLKVTYSAGSIILTAAKYGMAGTPGVKPIYTKLSENIGKAMQAAGIALTLSDCYKQMTANKAIWASMSDNIREMNFAEHYFSQRMMLKCREKYNRYETMVNMKYVKVGYDPSGIAYENGDIHQPVSGVTAEIWQADDASGTNARLWSDAADYDQVNTLITGDDGVYMWDTPTGWWQIRLHKDGYQDTQSEWLPVLPVQLGVNLEMIPIGAPDITPPTGKIQIGASGWDTFWNTITFGLFAKNTQIVTITGSDDSGGAVTIQYYLSSTELTSAQAQALTPSDWKDYYGAVNISPNNKYIVYAKLTDPSGNFAIINSAGVVLYTDSAAITADISFNKGSTTDVTANVALNGNTVSKITNGVNTLVSGTDYTVADGTITFKASYLDSLAASDMPYYLTVYYNPQGVAYADTPLDGSDAPATTVIALTVNATYTVTVNSGTGGGSYTEGAKVYITANAAPAGQTFEKWTSADGVTFADASAQSTSFTMPAKAVTVTATYKNLPPSEYAITVENDGNGTANADVTSATAGTQITLSATADSGYRFKEWQVVSGGVTVTDNKFTMPGNAVTVKAVFEPIPTFAITVTGGTADTTVASEGTVVTITADAAPDGKVFEKWTSSDGVTFANSNAESTTFTMPGKAVTVMANYKALPPSQYAITVENDGHGIANANVTSATAGTQITLTATPDSGYRFKEWQVIGGGITITDNKFTMPAGDVTVKAVFEPIPTYAITVTGGTADKTVAAEGTVITITAGAAPDDKVFEKWTSSDGVTFANANAESTTFTMPGKAVTVTATYKDAPPNQYAVSVLNDGHGTANANVTSATAGTQITLTATPDSGYRFKEWQVVSGGVTVTDNKFTMPGNAVTVKAIFELIPGETKTDYVILSGADGTWKAGTSAGQTITCNGDFAKFVGIKLDGVMIDANNYTAVSGSTAVTFKPEYLATLALGKHTVEFVYTDGSASTTLTILAADKPTEPDTTTPTEPDTTTPTEPDKTTPTTNPDVPKTGDKGTPIFWFILAGGALITLGGLTVVSRKRRYRIIKK